jgi:BNR repeat-like domain
VAEASRTALTTFLSVTNVQVSHDSALAHSEPSLAINPANPMNLIAGSKFFSNPAKYQFHIGTFYSMDGGRSWHDSGILPGFDDYGTTSDISIAFSPNGTIAYAAVLACNGGVCGGTGNGSGIYVSRSRDGGVTWESPTLVFADPTGAYFSDKPWIAVDASKSKTRGTVYVAWNLDGNVNGRRVGPDSIPGLFHTSQTSSGAPGGVVVARSIDYGSSFSSPLTLTSFDAQFQHFGLGATPAIAPDGRVTIVYLAQDVVQKKTLSSVQYVILKNRGATYSSPRPAVAQVVALPDKLPNSTFRNFSLPAFAISPRDGSMIVAWADRRNGDADIYESRSTDQGKTWSAPYRVNHDRIRDGKDQFQPALAVAPNGTFTCSWFDRRQDPKNHNIDVYIAQSMNDGGTFGHNYRITQHSWDPGVDAPDVDAKASTTFIGDYQALAVSNATVHPLWNDTQNGKSQEIRTAVVSVQLLNRR